MHLRVPTWAPYRLQFCGNGHHWLATRLRTAGVACRKADNAFVEIADYGMAQALADDLDVPRLHARLDRLVALCCPVAAKLGLTYHWSVMQVEYSTDIIFKDPASLKPVYEAIVRTAVLAIKPDQLATFLGRPLAPHYRAELGSRFETRIEGTCVKHRMGPAVIKMYDKFGLILRIETSTSDVSFFKHHRPVEQKNGQRPIKLAPLSKTIYSLPPLRHLLQAANRRYLEFLSALDDSSPGQTNLHRATKPVSHGGHSYRGLNFFNDQDQQLLECLARGENCIYGFRNKDLRRRLVRWSSGQISRRLKNLCLHGMIRRASRSYRYYLTAFGVQVLTAGLKIKELILIPQLAGTSPSSA